MLLLRWLLKLQRAMGRYSCSERVTALHTGLLNARRLVRMVTHPVVAVTSNMVWNFSSTSQVLLCCGCSAGLHLDRD